MTEHRYVNLRLDVVRSQVLPEGSRDLARLLTEWGLANEPQECAWVVAYDANLNVRNVTEVARGGHAEMTVEIQPVMTAVLALGALRFTFVHNHPTMTADPSVTDWHLTQKIMEAANTCGIVFDEHLIITPTGEYYSFRDAGLILPPARGIGGKRLSKAASGRKK